MFSEPEDVKARVIRKYNEEYSDFKPEMTIISLGAGLQSTVLYYMASMGIIQADCAIFADTGAEDKHTYDNLDYMFKWCDNNNGIPIYIVSDKNIETDMNSNEFIEGRRFASIPVFAKGGNAQLPRQCTREYKVVEVQKKIRSLYGLKKNQRNKKTQVLLGITVDEMQRMNHSPDKWIKNGFPFLDMRMTRNDCKVWLEKHKLLVPEKSSCYFCPYKSDSEWLKMKKEKPDSFRQSVLIDERIRASKRKVKEATYLHRSCQPLSEVKFKHEDNLTFDCDSGYCHL